MKELGGPKTVATPLNVFRSTLVSAAKPFLPPTPAGEHQQEQSTSDIYTVQFYLMSIPSPGVA